MNNIKKPFGGLKMNWYIVLILSVLAGILTGVVSCTPVLDDTSLHDIAITYEIWIVLAILIVTNCKAPLEASLKCLVFFVISQPLVYATEIFMGNLSIESACFYYLKLWFPVTVFTLPGGLIAYYSKKQNFIGIIITSVIGAMLTTLGVYHTIQAIHHFPNHIGSTFFCFLSMILIVLGVQEKKRSRIITFSLSIGISAIAIVTAIINGLSF